MANNSTLCEKVLGCLLGGAVGDAFGTRVEMMSYREIEARYGRVIDFTPLPVGQPGLRPPLPRWTPFGLQERQEDGVPILGRWRDEEGVYSDETRYRLMACQAIVRKRGPITGADLAWEWLNYRLMAEGATDYAPTLNWTGPQRAYARLMASLENLTQMAQQGRPCLAGWDAPMGLIHAGNPQAAASVGYSMAVAVAAAFLPNATIETVISQVLQYASSLGRQAGEFIGRMNRLLEIAGRCTDVFALREPFYRDFLVTFPPWEAAFSLEMVPCALALCLVSRGDAEQAIIGAASMGRDSDTLAAMAGEIIGTLYGPEALPGAWTDRVLRANTHPDLVQFADDLCGAIMDYAYQQQRRSTDLLALHTWDDAT